MNSVNDFTTRFDDSRRWLGSGSTVTDIVDMSTAHIVNTLAMFKKRPDRVLAVLLDDLEPWRTRRSCAALVTSLYGMPMTVAYSQLIQDVTSMSPEDLTIFALGSPCGAAMYAELEKRGVNVDNVMEVLAYQPQGTSVLPNALATK